MILLSRPHPWHKREFTPILLSLIELDSSSSNLAGERVTPINGITNLSHLKVLLLCMTQRKLLHFL